MQAGKILKIEKVSCSTDHTLVLDDGQVVCSAEWVFKYAPHVGGYFVRYKDGYESYSPAAAFEEGYSLDETV